MFLYLCQRVLEQSADDIHEHEVGHKVFGRPLDYDTAADNIVRVHASMLRKRIEQYFAAEGQHEPIVVEIPKGNYAPTFHERRAGPERLAPSEAPVAPAAPNAKIWILAALAALFACATFFLLFRLRDTASHAASVLAAKPAVRRFWSQIFPPDRRSDIVLDDADLASYQELTGRKIPLSEYFDRSYLRKLDEQGAAELNRNLAEAIVLKRHSNYGTTTVLWNLSRIADALQGRVAVHFARDYTFRELKSDNVILLGNNRSNPWIESFESKLGIRWKYNESTGAYYPWDVSAGPSAQEKFLTVGPGVEPREGYTMIALLPNLSGTGNVLIVSGSGGAAMGAAADFLSEESSLVQLRSLLPSTASGDFPYFEALLRVNTRSSLPKDTSILVCRPVPP
ncbi:MAG TPA: hypothetical protein VOA41_16915 [Candidatus Dormibacteraeota bacterium]|nr:hypothetical protein [Candidatus Dormibacteraeota bacterium]